MLAQPVRRHVLRRGIAVAVLVALAHGNTAAATPDRPTQADQAAPIDDGRAHQGAPALVADAEGGLYAVWQDFRDRDTSHVRFAYRPVGGGWQDNARISRDNAPETQPSLGVDGSGNAVAAWLVDRAGADRVCTADRPAGGAWGTIEVLTPRLSPQKEQMRPALAVNRRGDALLVWGERSVQTQDHGVYAAFRPAGGTWSEPERLTAFAGDGWSFDADAAIDDWGLAHALWTAPPRDALMHATRASGGSWSVPANIRGERDGTVASPALALDAAGNAHAVWQENRGGSGDIHAAYRPADGPWSIDVSVTDDASGASQSVPDVTVDGAGNAVAVWTDARAGRGDMYVSVRTRAAGWSANRRYLHWGPAGHAHTAAGVAPDGVQQMSQSPFSQACSAAGGMLYCAFGASTNPDGPYHAYVAEGPTTGADGDCAGAGEGGTDLDASGGSLAAPSTAHDRCAAGNGGEAPLVNADDGAQDWPAGEAWDVKLVEVDGQLFYVVNGADGHAGIFSLEHKASAVEFANAHAQPPGDPDAVPPAAPAGEPAAPAPALPPVPAPAPSPEPDVVVTIGDGGGPPLTPQLHASFQAAWLVGVSDLRPLTSDEQKELAWWFGQMNPAQAGYTELHAKYSANVEHWQAVAAAGKAAQLPPKPVQPGQPTPVPSGKPDKLTEHYKKQYGTEGLSKLLGIGDKPVTEPVLAHSGELVYEQTPLHIAGRGLDFRLRLTYRSQLVFDGPVGWGWEHDYDRRVVAAGGGSLSRWDGVGHSLPLSFDGARFTAPGGLFTRVVSTTSGISLTAPAGTVEGFFPLDGSPVAGRLRAIRDRHGNSLHFAYDDRARLATVIDTLGRRITYGYDAAGRLENVRDFTGRTVHLSHDASGDLVAITTAAVSGTPNGNDFPAGKTTRFAYTTGFDDARLNHNLTAVIAPNEVADGSLTARETNTYGTSGLAFDRVVAQSWGGGRANASGVPAGGDVTLAYSAAIEATAPVGTFGKTTITDRGGNVVELWHDGAGHRLRSRRVVSGQAVVYEYDYNAAGLVTAVTYPAGNRLEARYDDGAADPLARGDLLEVRRVPDAARGCDAGGGGPCPALVTSFTYEAAFHQVATITDPRGATTTFTYDARGDLTRAALPVVTGPGSRQAAELAWTSNEWGQPLSFTDAEGHVTRHEYGEPGGAAAARRTRTIQDSGGLDVVTSYERDAAGNVIAVTDARGVRTEYAVNSLGQVVKETRARAEGLDYERLYWYDANDNLVRIEVENVLPVLDADRHPTGAYARDAGDPWLTTTCAYDLLDDLVRVSEEGDGSREAVTEWRYDSQQRLTAVTSPQGRRTETVYDEAGRVVRRVTGAGSPGAAATTYAYDANGNLVRVTDGLEHPTDVVYDGYDRQTAVVDALGNVRAWRHDAGGNVVETTAADGQDGRNPARTAGAPGLVTLARERIVYDERNRIGLREQAFFTADVAAGTHAALATDGDGDGWVETAYAYDRASRLIALDDDRGSRTTYGYDGLGRVISRTDALGNRVAYEYDGTGNLVRTLETERQPDGLAADETFETAHSYDAAGRRVATTDNLGRTRRYAYDDRGHLVFESDAEGPATGSTNAHGNTATYAYDARGRLVSAARHLRGGGVGGGAIVADAVTTYGYDLDGFLVAHTDPRRNTTTYTVDAAGRPLAIAYADGTRTVLAYDLAGNLRSRTDAAGSVAVSSYDAVNRLVRTEVARGPGVGGTTLRTFAWDGLSRLTAATDDNDPAVAADDSMLGYQYDSLSHLTLEAQNGRAVTRTHDGAGNVMTLSYPDGTGRTFGYDALDRIREVRDGSVAIATYDWLGSLRPWRNTLGGSVVATYTYDRARNATGIEYVRAGDGTPIASFAYAYDRTGRRVSETVEPGGRRTTWAYDSAGRMIAAESPAGRQAYAYDASGNRTATIRGGEVEAYVADSVNAYTVIDGLPQTHDANGNVVRSHRIRRATADAARNAIYLPFATGAGGAAARTAAPSPTAPEGLAATGVVTETVIDLRYDYLDRVIAVSRMVTVTTEAGAQTAGASFGFAYDARDRQIAATGADGEHRMLYVGERVAEERDQAGELVGRSTGLQVVDRGGRLAYLLVDAAGTVRVIAGTTGVVEAVVEYEPFGRVSSVTGDRGIATSAPFLFQGLRDGADGTFYVVGERGYDPDAGRRMQRSRGAFGASYGDPAADPPLPTER